MMPSITESKKVITSNCYDCKRTFLIGVAGSSSSGKTEVCQKIMEKLSKEEQHQVGVVSDDAFYRELTDHDKGLASLGEFNFDHPDAFDFTKMAETLQKIKNGYSVLLSKYDFISHCKKPDDESVLVQHADVVLVEGVLLFYSPDIRQTFDLKLFVDTDSDVRLARRVLRDITERGRNLENVLKQYLQFVKPAFEEFCLPTKKYADFFIPRGPENEVAINLIVQHIQELLKTPRSSPLEDKGGEGAIRRHHSEPDSISRPH